MRFHRLYRLRYGRSLCILVLAGLTSLAAENTCRAQEKQQAVARCVAVEGALLMRTKSDGWRPVAAQAPVDAEQLLVSLFGAELLSANGAVGIQLIGDIGERGAFPVMEAAVLLHKSAAADAEITLSRGVLVLSNQKKDAAVKVGLRGFGQRVEVTLEPKARLAVEIYGRHVPGPPRLTDAKTDMPVTYLYFFALAGEPVIANERHTVRLQAPPGTSMMTWDSATKAIETRSFQKLPDALKLRTSEQRKLFQNLCLDAGRLALKTGTMGEHLDDLAKKTATLECRKVAVTAMAALDDLPRLVGALGNAKDAPMRDFSVLVLRNWLGREPGQSIKLYEYLTREHKFTSVQATTVLHLLNGFDQAKVRDPSTYEVLIHGLNHSKLPVRELARWHLVRLVPDGASIGYDAAADEAHRGQALAEWRRLIPQGELPTRSKQKRP